MVISVLTSLARCSWWRWPLRDFPPCMFLGLSWRWQILLVVLCCGWSQLADLIRKSRRNNHLIPRELRKDRWISDNRLNVRNACPIDQPFSSPANTFSRVPQRMLPYQAKSWTILSPLLMFLLREYFRFLDTPKTLKSLFAQRVVVINTVNELRLVQFITQFLIGVTLAIPDFVDTWIILWFWRLQTVCILGRSLRYLTLFSKCSG